MREQVTEEGRVLVEQGGQVQGVLGGDQLVEADLVWRQLRPVPLPKAVVWVRPRGAHTFEDHRVSLGERLWWVGWPRMTGRGRRGLHVASLTASQPSLRRQRERVCDITADSGQAVP